MRQVGGEGGPSVADRVFAVLEVCAACSRGLSLAELVDRTGMPKTTLHRVCRQLVELGMLERTETGFEIGTKLFALGGMNPLLRQLRASSMPLLHGLVQDTGMTANLAILSDDRALVVEEVYGGRTPALRRLVGGGLPLHATAIGKALFAGLPDDELDRRLDVAVLRPCTRNTVVRPNLFRQQIARARSVGVTFSHEEWILGVSGVASPVVIDGRLVCGVSVVGKLTPGQLAGLAVPVRRAATWLQRALESANPPVTPGEAVSRGHHLAFDCEDDITREVRADPERNAGPRSRGQGEVGAGVRSALTL